MPPTLQGPLAAELAAALARLDAERVVPRLWQHDHTLWSDSPGEIANRLGWLRYAPGAGERERMQQLLDQVRQEGIADVVLLGMGGSSLGAEALASSFPRRSAGSGNGWPRLRVLDTTVPEWVRAVRGAIAPARSLFLVASKSGGTAEVQALFDFFWQETTNASDDPGRSFVAITDPGTAIASLATARGFREIFVNDPDIGGRFSVLSLFGLVPATLAGLDVEELLARAATARVECGPAVAAGDNPGAVLGAFLGAGVAAGRDQLGILVPARLGAFGLWAEQLLAESTGKQGRGILPVAGEPLGDPTAYGPRRLFAHLRLATDPDPAVEAHAEALQRAGLPVLTLDLADAYDLAAQMFVWQVATAVAGHLIGVHPFDQPDVESAKARTRELLAATGARTDVAGAAAGDDLVAELGAAPAAYVALLAYLAPSPELESAVGALRRAMLARGLTTTFGYGPRYLHSTGQLHKGGPPGGLHVELLARRMEEMPIPGRSYGFATLARAQADGDQLALRAAGRRCVRLVLDDPAAELAELARRLGAG